MYNLNTVVKITPTNEVGMIIDIRSRSAPIYYGSESDTQWGRMVDEYTYLVQLLGRTEWFREDRIKSAQSIEKELFEQALAKGGAQAESIEVCHTEWPVSPIPRKEWTDFLESLKGHTVMYEIRGHEMERREINGRRMYTFTYTCVVQSAAGVRRFVGKHSTDWGGDADGFARGQRDILVQNAVMDYVRSLQARDNII